ncbi:hypothetical protein [Membranihabitans marinus]|uniref:hypothetical protein n=1 Tax=Membranihabitans marinus TaxID=1227546 RepID=UPI001F240F44|nr:hypothetical protein [Membranihabitans marinus]
MEKTKLYQLLNQISDREIKRIKSFLQSGLSSDSPKVIKLLDLLAPSAAGTSAILDKEKLWRKIFGKEAFNDGRFRKLCTDLFSELESAIAHIQFHDNQKSKSVHYLHYLRQQEIDDNVMKPAISKTKKQLLNRKKISGSTYYYQYRIEEIEYETLQHSSSAWSPANIEALDQNLNQFFIIEKLRVALSIFSRQKYIQIEKELPFLNTIFQLIEEQQFLDNPIIKLYYYAVKTYQSEIADEMYYALKDTLLDCIDILEPSNSRELSTIALSYCIGKINQNQTQFYRESFEWYETMLANRLLMTKEVLPSTTFRNIVLIAIRIEEFEWAQNFIEENHGYLEADKQLATKMLSLGQLYFNMKEYDKVMESLMNVEYLDVSFNLQSKLTLAATYYELNEKILLTNFLPTFNTYLRRKKPSMSADKFHRHLRFISILGQMIKIEDHEIHKWEALQAKIASDSKIVSVTWLNQKIAEKLKHQVINSSDSK